MVIYRPGRDAYRELSAEVPKFPPDVTGGALRSAGVHTLRHQNSVNAGASDSESQYWRLLLKLDRVIDHPVVEGTCRNSGDLCNCGRDGRWFPDRASTPILYVLPCVDQHVRD
jgi:hypothetical protein